MYNDDKWEFYKDAAEEWRWRRTAPNGEVVGTANEGYVNKESCIANAERHGYGTTGKTTGSRDNWEFYQDAGGKWRWRRTASNGEVVGAATSGYTNREDCVANAERHGYIERGG